MKTRWRVARDDKNQPIIRHQDGTYIRVAGCGGYAMVTAARIADLLNADDAAKTVAGTEARRAA